MSEGKKKPRSKAGATDKPAKTKKAIQVVAVVTPEGIEGTFTPEPRRPLIVHLPFKSSEVKFADAGELRYDPNPPTTVEPYGGDESLYFTVNQTTTQENEGWEMSITDQGPKTTVEPEKDTDTILQVQPTGVTPAPVENFSRTQILAAYATERGKTFTPPTSTPVRCYWCAQNFETAPCFLPVKEEYGVYTVYGNFCTPQCGLAYLLKEHLDSHVRWERMALLHRLYKPLDGKRIYPAPARETLQEFGGPLTVAQYREMISANKVRVDLHLSPLVSLLATMDTKPIDFYDSSLQNTFSATGGLPMDRFKAWSEQGGALRLKRAKPLKDRESTLDACIQISVKRGGE
jgi:hypothetical protein